MGPVDSAMLVALRGYLRLLLSDSETATEVRLIHILAPHDRVNFFNVPEHLTVISTFTSTVTVDQSIRWIKSFLS